MIPRGLLIIFLLSGWQYIQTESSNNIQEDPQFTIKSIEILDQGTELIFTSPVDFSDTDKITLTVKINSETQTYTTTVLQSVNAGDEVTAVFNDLNLHLPIDDVSFFIRVKDKTGTLSLTDIAVSESKIDIVGGDDKQSVRFRLAPDDEFKDTSISTCTKGSLCYLIEPKSNDIKEKYSVCQFLQPSTPGQQTEEVRLCQPVDTKTYIEGAVDLSTIELILEVSVVLESQFADGEHVEVVSYSSAEPHDQFTTTPYDCTIEGASCSLPIKPTEGRDLTHLVVVKNKDGEVIKSSAFDFINLGTSTRQISNKVLETSWVASEDLDSYIVSTNGNLDGTYNTLTQSCDKTDESPCKVYFIMNDQLSEDITFSVQKEGIENPACIVTKTTKLQEMQPDTDTLRSVTRSGSKIDLCFSDQSYTEALVLDQNGHWAYSINLNKDEDCFTDMDISGLMINNQVIITIWNSDMNYIEFTIGLLDPTIKQKTKDRLMIEMISRTSHDVTVTINEDPFIFQCNEDDALCSFYLKASNDVQMSISETTEIEQIVISSFTMADISGFDKEIEVSRSNDNRVKACFSPSSSANKYELAIVEDNILKDINTETIVEGDKTCALSASVLLLGGYVNLDVIISVFDDEEILQEGTEVHWKTISLVPYNHVYLALKDEETKIYETSWILLERTDNIANYSITVNSEDTADIQSLAVPASHSGLEMTLKSLQKYSVCVQALSSDPSTNSEIVCSHLGTMPDDPQIPPTKDVKLYCTATNVIVTWDPKPINITAYYISWTKKRKFVHPTRQRFLKSEENNFSIVPSSHNKIELPISSGTANDVCVCGVQDGVIATQCSCPSTPTDSKPPPDAPTQLNYDSATKDFSWAKVDGADTYVVEFEKEDLIHSEAVTDTKINVESIELEAGKWTMKVRAEKEGSVSSAAAIPQSIVNGIRILTTQKSASELKVTWDEYPQVQTPQDYIVKVDEEEKTVNCGVHTSCTATFTVESCNNAVNIEVSGKETKLTGFKYLVLGCIDVPSGLKSKKSSLNYKITWDSVPEASSYLLEHLNGDELLLQKEIHYTKYEFDGEDLTDHKVQVRSCKNNLCGDPTSINFGGNDGVETWIIVVSCIGGVFLVAAIVGGVCIGRSKSKSMSRKPSLVRNSNSLDNLPSPSDRQRIGIQNESFELPQGHRLPTMDDLVPQIGQRQFSPSVPPRPRYQQAPPRNNGPIYRSDSRVHGPYPAPRKEPQYDEWGSRPLGQPHLFPRAKQVTHNFNGNNRPMSPPNQRSPQGEYRF